MAKYNETSTSFNADQSRELTKDRTTIIPVETSIDYLSSDGKKIYFLEIINMLNYNTVCDVNGYF